MDRRAGIVVVDSNAIGTPFDFTGIWKERQRQAAALAASSSGATDAASPMLVRAASVDAVSFEDIVAGRRLDGELLALGDVVLLTNQTVPAENGPWVVGIGSADCRRPTGYAAAIGRQFFVSAGAGRRGTMYVCTSVTAGGRLSLFAVQGRPSLRDVAEERTYVDSLGVTAAAVSDQARASLDALGLRAATVGPETTPPVLGVNDSANARYIGAVLGIGPKEPVTLALTSAHDIPLDCIPGAVLEGSRPLVLGDRLLLTAQFLPVQNGIYVVGLPTARSSDMMVGTRAAGVTVFDLAARQTWICESGVTVGVDPLLWGTAVVTKALIDGLFPQAATLTGATPADNAANRQYITDVLGIGSVEPVQVSSTLTGNMDMAYDATTGAYAVGDRILLTAQADAVDNGVYVVVASGRPARAPDMREGSQPSGATVWDHSGSGRLWVCVSPRPALVGRDALHWVDLATGQANPTLTKQIVDALRVRATTIAGPTTTTEDAVTRTYLSTLGIRAGSLTGVTAADLQRNRGYITEDLGIGAKGPVIKSFAQPRLLATDFDVAHLAPDVRVGDRILIAAQDDPHENGLYVVNSLGVPTRTVDMRPGTRCSGATVWDWDSGRLWICTAPRTALVQDDEMPWVPLEGMDVAKVLAMVTKAHVDSLHVAASTVVGATPADDEANRLYVCDKLGLGTKSPMSSVVRVPLDLAAAPPFATGERVLLTAQVDARENGLYAVEAASFVRSIDLPVGSRASGVTVWDSSGRVLWVCTCARETQTVGRDPLYWSTGGNGTIAASARIVGLTAEDIAANSQYARERLGLGFRIPVRYALTSSADPDDLLWPGTVAVPGDPPLVPGDRILVCGTSDARRNVIFEVNTERLPKRPADMVEGDHVSGSMVLVTHGPNAGNVYVCTSAPGSDVVGVHSIWWRRGLDAPGRVPTGNKFLTDMPYYDLQPGCMNRAASVTLSFSDPTEKYKSLHATLFRVIVGGALRISGVGSVFSLTVCGAQGAPPTWEYVGPTVVHMYIDAVDMSATIWA